MRLFTILLTIIIIFSASCKKECLCEEEHFQCEDNHFQSDPSCQDIIKLSAIPIHYSNIEILSFEINDGCIDMTLGYSGCNGNHYIELVTNGTFAESLPPQLSLSFFDLEPQLCQAYFQQNYSYDLTLIKELLYKENYDEAYLNFHHINGETKKFLYKP